MHIKKNNINVNTPSMYDLVNNPVVIVTFIYIFCMRGGGWGWRPLALKEFVQEAICFGLVNSVGCCMFTTGTAATKDGQTQ